MICRSELNLGIQAAGFTVVKNTRPTEEHRTLMKVSGTVKTMVLFSSTPTLQPDILMLKLEQNIQHTQFPNKPQVLLNH